MASLKEAFVLLTLLVSAQAYVDDVVDYSKYSILCATPNTDKHVEFLRFLENEKSIAFKLDFWSHAAKHEDVRFGVTDENLDKIQKHLDEHQIPHYVAVRNFQTLIQKERKENPLQFSSRSKVADIALDQYHTYEEITAYVKNLAAENPEVVSVSVLQNTYENREILDVRVGLNSNDNKPVILIDAGIHAREWIAPATSLYILHELATKYNSDPAVKSLLTKYDWHFIPVVNPDGYTHTHTTNRMWRKNRFNSGNGCYGIDPNRNFPVGFGGESTSSNPCSDLYTGTNAFSEKESQAIKTLTEKYAKQIKAAITLHSYGQLWMSAWGYTAQHPKDYDKMLSVAKTAVSALKSVHGTSYQAGSIFEIIYPAGGGSTDWQYQTTGCPYSYAIELRDRGVYGFQLPRNLIIPTATETWAGIQAMVAVI